MVLVVPRLHRFDRGVSEVKRLVFALHQRFLVCDDLTVLIPVFDQFHGCMVLMPVGHKNQIRGKVVSLAGIRIDIDDFSFSRNDPQAAVPLIQDCIVSFSHGTPAAQQKQRERQNAAQRLFHHVVPLFVFFIFYSTAKTMARKFSAKHEKSFGNTYFQSFLLVPKAGLEPARF